MNFFRTLAMVGLVGVGVIDIGICKEAKDSDSETNPVVSSRWEVGGLDKHSKSRRSRFRRYCFLHGPRSGGR